MGIKRKKSFYLIVAILVLIEIASIFLMYKSSSVEITLDDVKLKNKRNDSFAIMLEQTDGTYIQSDSDAWPTDMKYNSEKSGCMDASGNIISESLTYDSSTNTATVKTNGATYCYLYFDKIYTLSELCSNGDNLVSCLTDNNSEIESLNDSVEGGLYRYQGTQDIVNDNYICFGTTNKSTCTGNTDAYMYRIIGVNENGQLKLTKKEALGSTMQWYSNYTTDIKWPQSTIYSNINGSSFLNNTTYVPSGWSDKIATTSWKYGDNTTDNTTAANLYATENAWTTTTNAKIGLIYAHDYYYAYQSGGLNCSNYGDYTTCKTSWMHLSNCDSGAPSTAEWTMSRYGYYGGNYHAWYVTSTGYVGRYRLTDALSVRPVFYLNADEVYTSGNGTIDDPIILHYEDTTAPTVTATVNNNNSSTPTITINSNESGTYCVNTSNTASNVSNCVASGSITAGTAITTSTLSTGTYYAHVKDASGNYGISSSVSVIVVNYLSEYLMDNPTTGLNTTMEAGLYRYQGTTANNYICFGTSDKSTCTGNTDAYMYRIIGITSDNRIKVIKKEALNSTMQWYSSYSSNITWPSSTIYSNINGSSFLTNATYVPSGWSDKIAITTWKYGDNTTYNITAANLYAIENSWTNTVSAKIGLWYMHDYYYGMSGGNNCSNSGAYSTCKTSWIYLWQSGNDTAAPNTSYEWTMSRSGYSSGAYYAWIVYLDGYVGNLWINNTYSVRPVFYLTNDVKFVGGTGTSSDPFLIS